MREVWIGLLNVAKNPGDQLITLTQKVAFTWFTCWAETAEEFEIKATEVMAHYGLHVIEVDDVSNARDREVGEELLEQIERTGESETHCLYGTFHTYPPQHF